MTFEIYNNYVAQSVYLSAYTRDLLGDFVSLRGCNESLTLSPATNQSLNWLHEKVSVLLSPPVCHFTLPVGYPTVSPD